MRDSQESRRLFIRRLGKVSIATPPALAMLLAVDGRNYAMAASGGQAIVPIHASYIETLFDLSYDEGVGAFGLTKDSGAAMKTYAEAKGIDDDVAFITGGPDPVPVPTLDSSGLLSSDPFPNANF